MDRFAYTGIRVRDLDRSLRFYTRVMGMRELLRGTMDHGGVYVHLKAPGSTQRLELNWYPRSSPHYRPYRDGEELDHLAWWVRDVPATFRRLVRRGAAPPGPPSGGGGWGAGVVSRGYKLLVVPWLLVFVGALLANQVWPSGDVISFSQTSVLPRDTESARAQDIIDAQFPGQTANSTATG